MDENVNGDVFIPIENDDLHFNDFNTISPLPDPMGKPNKDMDPTDSDLAMPVELKPMLTKGKMAGDGEESTSEGSSASNTSSEELSFPSCAAKVGAALKPLRDWIHSHKLLFIRIFYATLFCAYLVYLGFAAVLDTQRATPLLIVTALILLFTVFGLIKRKFGSNISRQCMKCLKPLTNCAEGKICMIQWLVGLVVVIMITIYLVIEIGTRPHQFTSVGGMFVFLLLIFMGSKHPTKVRWRPVVWGLALQFLLGVIILRTRWGYRAFNVFGHQIQVFLGYSDFGSRFVFGDDYVNHKFAFQVLPVIVFFSCVISILYHWGVMQTLISSIAWVMEKTLKTTATESLTAASNIFVGQTEAPIVVRPFIKDMTKSELHAMMTAGFATIAGGVLAAYILFGVPAEHLLGASVMNAPVALAVSKLMYPETEESRTKKTFIGLEKGKSRNFLEAASSGASAAISLVANIAANIIAFLALLAFVNAALSWFGGLVNHPELSFQLICSYVFMPIAFLMGVEWRDCGLVAELLGTKTFLNEFVAYEKLSEMIENRVNCVDTARQISMRSETIATYALCGFANLSSIGIQLGGIGPMAPSRKGDLAELALRALICGTTACFITACLAGVLTTEETFDGCRNMTSNATLSLYAVETLNLTRVHL